MNGEGFIICMLLCPENKVRTCDYSFCRSHLLNNYECQITNYQ
jgi:hypothetical protein